MNVTVSQLFNFSFFEFTSNKTLMLKMLGKRKWRGINLTVLSLVFPKLCFIERSWSHEISSSHSVDIKIIFFSSNYFLPSVYIFWYLPVAKRLMTSAYIRWCHQIFCFDLLQICCLRTVTRYFSIRILFFFLKYEGCSCFLCIRLWHKKHCNSFSFHFFSS